MKTHEKILLVIVTILAIVTFIVVVITSIKLEHKIDTAILQNSYLQNYIEPKDYYDTSITVLVKTGRGLSYQKFDNYNQILDYITMLKSLSETKEGLSNGK